MDRSSPEGKAEEQKHEKQVQVPGLEEFLAEAEGETLVAATPRLGEVDSKPAHKVVAEVDLGVEKDEEEEENPHTHFKENVSRPSRCFPSEEEEGF